MTEENFGEYWALYIIALNFSVIFFLFVLLWLGGFDADQVTTLIEIISPMFAYCVVPAIHNIAKNQKRRRASPSPRVPFVLQSFIIPAALYVIMAVCMFLQAQGRTFADFEQFKLLWATLQALFALYVGANRDELFPKSVHAH